MIKQPGNGAHWTAGLSEVIGFVLILGLLTVVFALYLTYGVPAQGRESEILHMNEIKDQFVGYKLSLDSLFINNKVGMTVSDSFNLGTAGGYTQGMMSIVPVMSPIPSGGVIAINQRTTVPETLSFSSRSLILNSSTGTSISLPVTYNSTPSHVYINISGIQASDLTANGFFGATASTNTWTAQVNLTPELSYYQVYKSVVATTCPTSANGTVLGPYYNYAGNYNCLVPLNVFNYTASDVTLTVKKGTLVTVLNYPVSENIRAGTTYTVDLMDPAYGLSTAILPADTITLTTTKTLGSVTARGNITYDYREMNPYSVSPLPMGAVEYRSQNNYWLDQSYYYQTGGVFLSQADGNTTYKLPPEITFSYNNVSNLDPSRNIVTVNINALRIDPNNRGVVGGNSPVQIKSRLTDITPFPYAAGPANTKWIRIAVNTTDSQARTMWKNFFDYTATVAGIPNFQVSTTGNETSILINGYDTTDTVYDINVIASDAVYSTSIHGIGGVV